MFLLFFVFDAVKRDAPHIHIYARRLGIAKTRKDCVLTSRTFIDQKARASAKVPGHMLCMCCRTQGPVASAARVAVGGRVAPFDVAGSGTIQATAWKTRKHTRCGPMSIRFAPLTHRHPAREASDPSSDLACHLRRCHRTAPAQHVRPTRRGPAHHVIQSMVWRLARSSCGGISTLCS